MIKDWSEALSKMRIKRTFYFLKEDTQKKRPFLVRGTVQDFDNPEKEYVSFYCPRDKEPAEYVMELEKFKQRFYASVIED
jgi:hypothetical protein